MKGIIKMKKLLLIIAALTLISCGEYEQGNKMFLSCYYEAFNLKRCEGAELICYVYTNVNIPMECIAKGNL